MVKTLPSIAEVVGSIPGQGTKVPHAAQCRQNKQTTKKKPYSLDRIKKILRIVKEENSKDLIERNSERIRKNMLEAKRNPPGLGNVLGLNMMGRKDQG